MTKPDTPQSDLVPLDDSQTSANSRDSMVGPSTNPATNLLIADVVLRGASSLFRKRVEKGMVKTSPDEAEARDILDGRGIMTTLALYGVSKLATRSPVGLGLVAGGLVLKTLYDRGKSVEKSKKAAGKD